MSTPTCAYARCPRPVYQNPKFPATDKCIFHCECKDPQEFRNALAKQIREWRLKKSILWDFDGWVFVDHFYRPKAKVIDSSNLFKWAVFPGMALFRGAVFLVNADFSNAIFHNAVTFFGAKFHKFAWFVNAEFREAVEFLHASFVGSASFHHASFKSKAEFTACEFARDASFRGVKFMSYGTFELTKFSGETFFEKVVFSGIATFQNAIFGQHADFKHASFYSDLNLYGTSFAIIGDFNHISILGHVRLLWPGRGYGPNWRLMKYPRGLVCFRSFTVQGSESIFDLRGVQLPPFPEDGRLLMEDVKRADMNFVLFKRADCRRIEFFNVEWPQLDGRQIVGDEYFARLERPPYDNGVDWSLIAITYQQLTDRFRRDLNHDVANDFERGIFEARLMTQIVKNSKKTALLLRFYKWSSDFGGSITRPVWIALLVTALCAFMYGAILYGGSFAWPLKWQAKLIEDSLVAAFRVISLDRGQFSRELDSNAIGLGGRLLASGIALLQTALTATLVTLFIFAIRRRFKHSE